MRCTVKSLEGPKQCLHTCNQLIAMSMVLRRTLLLSPCPSAQARMTAKWRSCCSSASKGPSCFSAGRHALLAKTLGGIAAALARISRDAQRCANIGQITCLHLTCSNMVMQLSRSNRRHRRLKLEYILTQCTGDTQVRRLTGTYANSLRLSADWRQTGVGCTLLELHNLQACWCDLSFEASYPTLLQEVIKPHLAIGPAGQLLVLACLLQCTCQIISTTTCFPVLLRPSLGQFLCAPKSSNVSQYAVNARANQRSCMTMSCLQTLIDMTQLACLSHNTAMKQQQNPLLPAGSP